MIRFGSPRTAREGVYQHEGRKWWATLESNQACVSARELQSPATPCGLSPTFTLCIAPDVKA